MKRGRHEFLQIGEIGETLHCARKQVFMNAYKMSEIALHWR